MSYKLNLDSLHHGVHGEIMVSREHYTYEDAIEIKKIIQGVIESWWNIKGIDRFEKDESSRQESK